MADEKPRRPTGTIPIPGGPSAPEGKQRTLSGIQPITGGGTAKAGAGAVQNAEKKRTLTGMVPILAPLKQGGGAAATASGIQARDPRVPLIIPVRYRFESFIDFVETQSMNISRSGMFVISAETVPAGSTVEFEFSLADGFAILKGKAEVMRVTRTPPVGMGIRFQAIDDASRKLIHKILEVNLREGRKPTVAMDFAEATARPGSSPEVASVRPGSSPSLRALDGKTGHTPGPPGVVFDNRDLRVEVNPATVGYFIHNPLLNIRLGGFVVPAAEDVPLGTIFNVSIFDLQGGALFDGKGKVVAKHDMRLGIRLTYTDKAAIAPLQAEIGKLAPSK